MPYILPKGTYYDAGPHVAEGSIECAVRPTRDHVLTDNWQDAPMDVKVCWRVKTPKEIDTEKEIKANELLDNPVYQSIMEVLFSMNKTNKKYLVFGELKADVVQRIKKKI